MLRYNAESTIYCYFCIWKVVEYKYKHKAYSRRITRAFVKVVKIFAIFTKTETRKRSSRKKTSANESSIPSVRERVIP